MASLQLLSQSLGIDIKASTKNEITILEATLLCLACKELKNYFLYQHRTCFSLLKISDEMEKEMIDEMFVSLVIKDILNSEEYNLHGIARYTGFHEDVIQDVLDGQNTNPSAKLLQRIIELHRIVRRDLYASIFEKIIKPHTINIETFSTLCDRE